MTAARATLGEAVKALAAAATSVPKLARPTGDDGSPAWEVALERVLVGEEKENMATNDAQIVVRLPSEVMDRVDAYAERLRGATPGLRVSRSEAARALILMALAEVEPEGRRGRR